MRYFIIILCFCLTSCVTTNQPFDTIRVSLDEVTPNQNIAQGSEQLISLQQDSIAMTAMPEIKTEPEIVPVVEIKTEPEIIPVAEVKQEVKTEPEITPVAEVKTEPEIVPVAEIKTEPEVTPIAKQEIISETPQKLPEPKLMEKLPETIDELIQLQTGKHYINYNITITNKGKLILLPGTALIFDKCGIFCQGQIDAKEVIFTSTRSGWDNITFDGDHALGSFDSCILDHALGREVAINDQCEYTNTNMCIGGPLLFANHAKGKLERCTIGNNSSLSAVALVYASEVSMIEIKVVDNKNAGILAVDSNFNLKNSEVFTIKSTSKTYGIICRKNTKCAIEDTVIGGNHIGIEMQDNAQCELNNIKFIRNINSCVCKNSSTASISNCRFSHAKPQEIIVRDNAKAPNEPNNNNKFDDTFEDLRN